MTENTEPPTLKALQDRAKALNIDGRSGMEREALEAAIGEAEAELSRLEGLRARAAELKISGATNMAADELSEAILATEAGVSGEGELEPLAAVGEARYKRTMQRAVNVDLYSEGN